MNRLQCQRKEESFEIEYEVAMFEGEWNLKIPTPCLKAGNTYQVTNNLPLYGDLGDVLAASFISSTFWESLKYSVKLQVEADCTFAISLECSEFNSIFSELKATVVDHITINFNYYCEGPNLIVRSLVEALEYAFVSLMLHLEIEFPLIFGVSARTTFFKSYFWIKRSIREITTSYGIENTPPCTNEVECYEFALQQNLEGLYKWLATKSTLKARKYDYRMYFFDYLKINQMMNS